MDNITYLIKSIEQVKSFIAKAEQRVTAGEWWMVAQRDSFQHHLDDLLKRLAEAKKSKEGDERTSVRGNFECHARTVPVWHPYGHGHGFDKWRELTASEKTENLATAYEVSSRKEREKRLNTLADATRFVNNVKSPQSDTEKFSKKSDYRQKSKFGFVRSNTHKYEKNYKMS